jgi:hypothetical protein
VVVTTGSSALLRARARGAAATWRALYGRRALAQGLQPMIALEKQAQKVSSNSKLKET